MSLSPATVTNCLRETAIVQEDVSGHSKLSLSCIHRLTPYDPVTTLNAAVDTKTCKPQVWKLQTQQSLLFQHSFLRYNLDGCAIKTLYILSMTDVSTCYLKLHKLSSYILGFFFCSFVSNLDPQSPRSLFL